MELDPGKVTDALLNRTREVAVKDVEGLLAAATAAIIEMGVADSASITECLDDGTYRTRVASDERAMSVDQLEYHLSEGPCLEAAAYEELDGVVFSGDLRGDPRWPRWGPAAAEHGVGAAISVQLFSHGETMGALNLFYADRRDFTTHDLEVARLAAVPISIELAHGRRDDHLWRAIEARHRVGLAQGILMERFKIDEPQAFATLRRVSQQTNTKLHLVADQLIRTGELTVPQISAGEQITPGSHVG